MALGLRFREPRHPRDGQVPVIAISMAIRTLPCANIPGLDSRLGRDDGGPERRIVGFRLRLDRILFS